MTTDMNNRFKVVVAGSPLLLKLEATFAHWLINDLMHAIILYIDEQIIGDNKPREAFLDKETIVNSLYTEITNWLSAEYEALMTYADEDNDTMLVQMVEELSTNWSYYDKLFLEIAITTVCQLGYNMYDFFHYVHTTGARLDVEMADVRPDGSIDIVVMLSYAQADNNHPVSFQHLFPVRGPDGERRARYRPRRISRPVTNPNPSWSVY